MPTFQAGRALDVALGSLLTQHHPQITVTIVDDASTDGTFERARTWASRDDRVRVHRNPHRIGLTRNWRAAFHRARAHAPEAPYFAWAGDHDRWAPSFASTLAAALDRLPAAVTVYPLDARESPDGSLLPGCMPFSTLGGRPGSRLVAAAGGMCAGSMVYGVARASALSRAGVFRDVLAPDRLLLAELALQGDLVQVPETLWYRRATARPTSDRQRAAIFPNGVPVHGRLPSSLVHSLWLARLGAPLGAAVGYLVAMGSRDARTRSVEGLYDLEGHLPVAMSVALRRWVGLGPRDR